MIGKRFCLLMLLLLTAVASPASTIIFQLSNWNLSSTNAMTNSIKVWQVGQIIGGNGIQAGLPIWLNTTNGYLTNKFAAGNFALSILNGAPYPYNQPLYFQSYADTNFLDFTNAQISGGDFFVTRPAATASQFVATAAGNATNLTAQGNFAGDGGGLTNINAGQFNPQAANSILGNGTGASTKPMFSTNGDYTAHSLTAQTFTGSFIGDGTGLTISPTTNTALLNAAFQAWNLSGTNTFGSLVINSNNGTGVPLQIYTNQNAVISGNNTLVQFGTAANPAMALFELNPGHGGIGDGSEFGIDANQIAIVGTSLNGFGGRLQFGAQGGQSPWCFSYQNIGTPNGSTSFYTSNNSFARFKYGWWNGSSAVVMSLAQQTSFVNLTTGQAALTTYDAYTPNLDNDSPAAQPHRQDIIGGLGVKNYGATILDATNITPASTNYPINLAQAEQDVYLAGAINLSLTNVNALTNTANGTSSALKTTVVLYGGIGTNLVTWAVSPAVNMIWVGETNTNVPAAMSANQVMTIDLMLSVTGGVTNCIAHAMSGPYNPVIDPLATAFFAATSLSTPSTKLAINNFCLAIRSGGLVPKLKFCYPFIGPNAATNNVDLIGLHNAVQHGTVTNNANGIFSDGTTGYLDTGAIASTSLASANSTFMAVWCKTVNPANGDAISVRDSAVYEGLAAGGTFTVANGLNVFSQADGQGTGNNSQGFNAVNRTAAGSQTIYNPATPAGRVFTDITATALPNTYSLYISARNDQGTADHFFAGNISLAAWGDGFTSTDVANFATAVANLQTALGR